MLPEDPLGRSAFAFVHPDDGAALLLLVGHAVGQSTGTGAVLSQLALTGYRYAFWAPATDSAHGGCSYTVS